MSLLGQIASVIHESANVCAVLMQNSLHERTANLHKQMMRLMVRIAFLKLAMLLIAAGIGFLLWGGYRMLAACVSPALASLIIGSGILIIGLLFGWILKKSIP
ncbi:MAG: hypothetical protein LLF76_01425 [Planctomycetaceae bacterium]|nr:hypothetical protein [Planctomycetaceae bacterium]